MAKIKKNDNVLIRKGKDAGKTGRVISVLDGGSKVIVEKLNMIWRHQKPSQKNVQGGRVEKEAPIRACNVMLVGRDGKPSRVGFKTLDSGQKVRWCHKQAKMLD